MVRVGGYRPGTRMRVAAFLSAVVLGLVGSPAALQAALPANLVFTSDGAVWGSVTPTMRTFFGIPFAKPTSGALRFHAPVPVAPWLGVRLALWHSTPCAQSLPVVGTLLPSGEDCLGVDVYTPPAAVSHNLPVMVFIYGGGYVIGSNDGYDPTPIVNTGKVIVVTLNYRVGPFGFLALPGLDSESPGDTSGDYGLMDQQAGLRWVRQNIAAFGGNPSNVTIFGESAGGNSVCQQIASPLAAGLFQRAISESGSCSGTTMQESSEATMVQRSEAYAARVGCPDLATMVACLRALPVSALLNDPSVAFGSGPTVWEPAVDGYVEPRGLDDAWRSGQYNHVPMLLGNNLNEGRLFVALQELSSGSAITPAEYETSLQEFGSDASSVLAEYPIAAYGAADLAESAVVTDSAFACPATYTAAEATATGQPVWTYEFADPDPPYSGLDKFMPLGDYHASELFYLFNSVNLIPAPTRTAAQSALSAQMVNAWTTFASTGQPGPVGGTAWPQWSPWSPQTMVLTSLGSHLSSGVAAEHKCGFWTGIIGG